MPFDKTQQKIADATIKKYEDGRGGRKASFYYDKKMIKQNDKRITLKSPGDGRWPGNLSVYLYEAPRDNLGALFRILTTAILYQSCGWQERRV